MRTKEAARNTTVSLISYIFIAVIGFVSQKIFKDVLGAEYLGLNGLFTNIMTMLSIAELGFGTAIVSNMYKPVAENDELKILELLQFYKKIYRILAIVIVSIGICLMPFINFIVGKNDLDVNFRFIFCFYLADTALSYCFTYKRSILYAYQKTYYTSIIHTICVILMNVFQIIILLATHNYYLYLTLKVSFRLIENIEINRIADKKYPFIKTKEKYKLEKNIIDDIIRKIKGLIFHRIGTFVVTGSDNIIISTLPNLGLKYVGIYSNYSMIINQLYSIVNQMFNSLTASVGNLLVEKDTEKSYGIMKKLLFFDGWIYIYMSCAFYMISKPFIQIWMGKDYLVSEFTLITLSVNFFIQGMRASYSTFKDAAGIFYEDRYVPLIECVVNVVFSIGLGLVIGLPGIFIGTICSNCVLFLYSFPKFVYKEIFHKNLSIYLKDLFIWILYFSIIFIIIIIISNIIVFKNVYLNLLFSFVISLIIPNLMLILLNFKNSEFNYYFNLLKNLK